MFIIKNAVKNMYRFKNKYLIFGILYLILIFMASISINVYVQMTQVSDKINKEYASVIKFLHIPGGSTNNSNTSNPYIASPSTRATKDDIFKYKSIEHIHDIKLYRYNFSTLYLKRSVSPLKKELHINGDIIFWDDLHDISFYILGYNTSLMYLMGNDDFKLEKGRMFEKENEAVIEKNRNNSDYPEWNDLDLNDKIVIKNDDGIYKEFTIVGITEQDPDVDMNGFACLIYTKLESAEYFDSIAGESAGNWSWGITMDENWNTRLAELGIDKFRKYQVVMGYNALIFLDSYDYMRDVQIKAQERGATVDPFFEDYKSLTELSENMKKNVTTFIILIGVLIVGITIISTMISLNSRKYEIAVLRSVGMKKNRIILNYLIENIVFIWGITLIALIAAQYIAKTITIRIFENTQDLISEQVYNTLTNGINLDLLLKNVGFVFGGTFVVIILSLIIACINITKFQPLKIFNKQH